MSAAAVNLSAPLENVSVPPVNVFAPYGFISAPPVNISLPYGFISVPPEIVSVPPVNVFVPCGNVYGYVGNVFVPCGDVSVHVVNISALVAVLVLGLDLFLIGSSDCVASFLIFAISSAYLNKSCSDFGNIAYNKNIQALKYLLIVDI